MISGELFQSLAEISLCDNITEQICNQKRCMPQNIKSIYELQSNEIAQFKRIFIYTDCVDKFFDKFFDYISKDVIIITHNSDEGITQKHHKYLDSDKISRWYCQNMETFHPKLFSIPIGLANSQWPHGNQQLIKSVKDKNIPKEYLVYKNFNVGTNYNERVICNEITTRNGIPFSFSRPVEQYWEMLAKSMFVISPPGNGIDCHRIWEALYLRTVPVIKQNIAFSQFTNLPILQVDDWNIVTPQYLKNKVDDYKDFNWDTLKALEIDYWKNLICIE